MAQARASRPLAHFLQGGLQPRRDGVPDFGSTIDRARRVVGIQLGGVARIAHVDSVVGQLHRRGEGGRKRSIDWGD